MGSPDVDGVVVAMCRAGCRLHSVQADDPGKKKEFRSHQTETSVHTYMLCIYYTSLWHLHCLWVISVAP